MENQGVDCRSAEEPTSLKRKPETLKSKVF